MDLSSYRLYTSFGEDQRFLHIQLELVDEDQKTSDYNIGVLEEIHRVMNQNNSYCYVQEDISVVMVAEEIFRRYNQSYNDWDNFLQRTVDTFTKWIFSYTGDPMWISEYDHVSALYHAILETSSFYKADRMDTILMNCFGLSEEEIATNDYGYIKKWINEQPLSRLSFLIDPHSSDLHNLLLSMKTVEDRVMLAKHLFNVRGFKFRVFSFLDLINYVSSLPNDLRISILEHLTECTSSTFRLTDFIKDQSKDARLTAARLTAMRALIENCADISYNQISNLSLEVLQFIAKHPKLILSRFWNNRLHLDFLNRLFPQNDGEIGYRESSYKEICAEKILMIDNNKLLISPGFRLVIHRLHEMNSIPLVELSVKLLQNCEPADLPRLIEFWENVPLKRLEKIMETSNHIFNITNMKQIDEFTFLCEQLKSSSDEVIEAIELFFEPFKSIHINVSSVIKIFNESTPSLYKILAETANSIIIAMAKIKYDVEYFTEIFEIIALEIEEIQMMNGFSLFNLRQAMELKLYYLTNLLISDRYLQILFALEMCEPDQEKVSVVSVLNLAVGMVEYKKGKRPPLYWKGILSQNSLTNSIIQPSVRQISGYLKSLSRNKRERFFRSIRRFFRSEECNPQHLNDLCVRLKFIESCMHIPLEKCEFTMNQLLILFEDSTLKLIDQISNGNMFIPSKEAESNRNNNSYNYVTFHTMDVFYIVCTKLVPILLKLKLDEFHFAVKLSVDIFKQCGISEDDERLKFACFPILFHMIAKILLESPSNSNLEIEERIRVIVSSQEKIFLHIISRLYVFCEQLRAINQSERMMKEDPSQSLNHILRVKHLLAPNRILPSGQSLKSFYKEGPKDTESSILKFLD